MESRKVIKSGPSSLSITLPNSWLKDNDVKKGDDVFLDVENNIIKVLPQKNINEVKENKEYIIDTNKLYLIKEHLNYCFLNNYDVIKIKMMGDDIESVINIINNFTGYSYNIKKDTIIIYNLLNLEDINLPKEIESIINSLKFIFKEICENTDQQKQEIVFKLRGIKKRSFISYATINKLLKHPLKSNKFNLKLEDQIKFKFKLTEIPYLINSLVEFVKQIGYINNLKPYKSLFLSINNNLLKKSKLIEKRFNFRSLIEKINLNINRTEKSEQLRFLNELKSIVSSFERISI